MSSSSFFSVLCDELDRVGYCFVTPPRAAVSVIVLGWLGLSVGLLLVAYVGICSLLCVGLLGGLSPWGLYECPRDLQ